MGNNNQKAGNIIAPYKYPINGINNGILVA
jgi:hypothetical protein